MPGIGTIILQCLCGKCTQAVKDLVPVGKVIYFPKGYSVNPAKVRKMRRARMTISRIAKEVDLTERRIYQLLQKTGR